MAYKQINLDAIDFQKINFSTLRGEFLFQEQSYQIKQYMGKHFFRNKKRINSEFICLLDSDLAKSIYQNKYPPFLIEQKIKENQDYIYRCIQYKEALFAFGIIEDQYYSPELNEWIELMAFNYQACKNIRLDDLLEQPYNFFIEQAETIYNKELPLIQNDEFFAAFRTKTKTQACEFVCGSKLELERLARIVAFTLPEFESLFECSSSFDIIYNSANDYYSGGVAQKIRTQNWKYEVILSKHAQQLLNLVFEYNFFTGLCWEYTDGSHDYTSFDLTPYSIYIEVQAPSQHERIEAVLALQSWLEGKLPKDEIESYFEK